MISENSIVISAISLENQISPFILKMKKFGYFSRPTRPLKTNVANHRETGKGSSSLFFEKQQKLQQKLGEIYGKTHDLQLGQLDQVNSSVQQLSRIIAMMQTESTPVRGDLPTSFVPAAMKLAKCISQFLEYENQQNADIQSVLTYLNDYKALTCLPNGKYLLSPHKVHLILQDNFQDSSLTLFFNILFAGWINTETKSILF